MNKPSTKYYRDLQYCACTCNSINYCDVQCLFVGCNFYEFLGKTGHRIAVTCSGLGCSDSDAFIACVKMLRKFASLLVLVLAATSLRMVTKIMRMVCVSTAVSWNVKKIHPLMNQCVSGSLYHPCFSSHPHFSPPCLSLSSVILYESLGTRLGQDMKIKSQSHAYM